jgi:hypothetical protein
MSRRYAGAGGVRRQSRGGNAATSVGSTPTALGASYHLHAADLAAGAVSSWAPRIGTGTLTQGTGALQPAKEDTVVAFGNQPAVNFSLTTHKLAVAATYVVPLAITNGYTVVAVQRDIGASTYIWGQLSAVSAKYARYGGNLLRHEESTTTTSAAITLTNAASCFWQCSSARVLRFGLNGVQVGTDQTHPAFAASGAPGQFILGDVGGPGFIGYVAEFIVFPRVLSAAELLSLHTKYIAPVYGF